MSSAQVHSTSSPTSTSATTPTVAASNSSVILVAKFDYSAKEPHELDLKKGERLFLIDNSKQWWLVRKLELTGNEQTG